MVWQLKRLAEAARETCERSWVGQRPSKTVFCYQDPRNVCKAESEHSCECHRLTTYPFDGLFAYISVTTYLKGTANRPNTEQLRSITASQLADELGLVHDSGQTRQWRINDQNNVLIFNPQAVDLDN